MKKRSFVFLFRFFFFVSSRAALFVVFLPSSAIKEDEETQIGELSRNKKKQSIKNSLARAALDVAVPYAAQRKQFNTRIGDFQLVAAKLADGWTRTQAARALVYSAAAKADAKKKGGESSSSSSPSSNNSPTYLSVSGGWSSKGERARECAAAILFSAETATQVALDALQVLGGNGYINEYPTGAFFLTFFVFFSPLFFLLCFFMRRDGEKKKSSRFFFLSLPLSLGNSAKKLQAGSSATPSCTRSGPGPRRSGGWSSGGSWCGRPPRRRGEAGGDDEMKRGAGKGAALSPLPAFSILSLSLPRVRGGNKKKMFH